MIIKKPVQPIFFFESGRFPKMDKKTTISIRPLHDKEEIFELGKWRFIEFEGIAEGMEDGPLHIQILTRVAETGGFVNLNDFVDVVGGTFRCPFPLWFPERFGSIPRQTASASVYLQDPRDDDHWVDLGVTTVSLKCVGLEEKKEEDKKKLMEHSQTALENVRDSYISIAETRKKIKDVVKSIEMDFERQAMEHVGLGIDENEPLV